MELNWYENLEKILGTRKMSEETNSHNIAVVHDLVEHFYLSRTSIKLVHQYIDEPPGIHQFNDWWLGPDHRVFIPTELSPENDEGYHKYQQILPNYEIPFDAYHYSVWKSGLYKNQKLFRYLKKCGIPENILTELSTTRQAATGYIVLSKNPTDFLMLSTGHSWRSCMSLNSSYENAVYMGLPMYWVDPLSYILFYTSGKISTYDIKGYTIKYFKYITRSIAVPSKNGLLLARQYPSNNTPVFENALPKIGLKLAPKQYSINYESYKTHKPLLQLYFQDDSRCAPYYDMQRNTYSYSNTGCSGSWMNNDFNWTGGFEAIQCWEDLESGNDRTFCTFCEEYFDGEPTYTSDENRVCPDCLDENYRFCDRCNEYYNIESDYRVEECHRASGSYHELCRTCRERLNIKLCEFCDQYDEVTYLTTDGEHICQSCIDNNSYQICNSCGEASTDCVEAYNTDQLYCENCQHELHHCPNCDTFYEKE